MKKKLLAYALLLAPALTFGQFKWDFGGSAGFSNYLGDIGGEEETRKDFVADLKFSQTRWALDGFARYKFHPNISVKMAITYGRISGRDELSTNPGRNGRNLSFFNNLWEISTVGQFFFYEVSDVGKGYRYKSDLRFYVFAGVGGLYQSPKTRYNGSVVKLQPLQTEGVKYSKFQFVIPTGTGMYYTFKRYHRIGWELGWRTTFTDYLDDISTVYADPSSLGSPLAVDLSNRNDELSYDPLTDGIPHPNNYAPGSKRGDPTHNDSYIFTTFSYSYVIKGRSKFAKKRYKQYFKKKRYKKRKIRAKF
jgi:hypothetical protein